jgi:hypothetical protein
MDSINSTEYFGSKTHSILFDQIIDVVYGDEILIILMK